MDKPSECNILSEILNENPRCRESCSAKEAPSYIDRRDYLTPKGCLLAHLILTLIEMQRASSCFKIPFNNLFTCGKNADDCWSILLTSSILHDVGKLVNEYVTSRSYILHHQISAIIGKRALESITDDSTALRISYAILFHHEAIDWKAVYKSLLLFSYLQRALSPTGKIIYTVNQNRLNEFKQNLYRILDQIYQKKIITQFQHRILTETSNYAMQELKNNQGFALDVSRELNAAKIRDLKYLMPALALYRLLYLSDNRAASARDQYWLRLIQQVNWEQLDNVAWQISSFLSKKYYYIGLSSIPDL